jgi:hypothetical protein
MTVTMIPASIYEGEYGPALQECNFTKGFTATITLMQPGKRTLQGHSFTLKMPESAE